MSALMVRPEEELTPAEGAAMVISKALVSVSNFPSAPQIYKRLGVLEFTGIIKFVESFAQDLEWTA